MTYEEWQQSVLAEKKRWEKECIKKPVGPAFTDSRMPVDILYMPADLPGNNASFDKIGMPGEYPFTRGV